jgi:DNA polymerase alpha-associated DNA helicase A
MHSLIIQFPSDTLYSSLLVAADSVKSRLLSTLPYEVQETEDTTEPLIFFDTQGGDFPEKNEEEEEGKGKKGRLLGDSKSNEMEALLVKRHVGNLVEAGVKEEDIAVITPYNAQVSEKFLWLRTNKMNRFGWPLKSGVFCKRYICWSGRVVLTQ